MQYWNELVPSLQEKLHGAELITAMVKADVRTHEGRTVFAQCRRDFSILLQQTSEENQKWLGELYSACFAEDWGPTDDL